MNLEIVQKTIARIHSYGKPVDFARPFNSEERRIGVGTGSFVKPPPYAVDNIDNTKLYILTCAHVIDQADQVTIQIPLAGREEIPATVLSFVPRYSFDLALISVDDPDGSLRDMIEYLQLGSSERLKQGDKLVALGFPMGQRGLMTSDGVYSGFQHELQHTVPISPGNSGGPLVAFNNGRTEWVGVNTSGITDVRASNIGYAVPIEYFKLSEPTLFSQQTGPPGPQRVFRRPSFGLMLQESTGAQIKVENNGANCCKQGMYVFEVDPKSPAAKKGVVSGDYLCQIDNMKVDNRGEVRVSWNQQPVPVKAALNRMTDTNKQYKLRVWKTKLGKCQDLNIAPARLHRGALKFLYPPYDSVDYVAVGGVVMMQLRMNHALIPATLRSFAELSPKERRYAHVVVTHIVPGTQADKSNILKQSDIIISVNGSPVKTLKHVRNALLNPLQKNNVKFVEIKSKQNKKLILLLKDVGKEDLKLKELGVYNPDNGIIKLYTKVTKVIDR